MLRDTAKFQSTPPARGATAAAEIIFKTLDISIHAPREGGDVAVAVFCFPCIHFNPRPPRGGRLERGVAGRVSGVFQSTPPARGATLLLCSLFPVSRISIHAPREGGDPHHCPKCKKTCKFQSTPPARGATVTVGIAVLVHDDFNPRPPRGGRLCTGCSCLMCYRFQSTPPARGATAKMHSFTCGSLTNK